MTDKLKAIITEAEMLPPETQDALAEAVAIFIDEMGWDKRFATPKSQEMLQRMAQHALQEHSTGQTEDFERLVQFSHYLIDSGAGNESNPLASLLDLLGVLITSYEREHGLLWEQQSAS